MIETAGSASAFVYKSRARNEPTNVTLPQWSSAMWNRIDTLITDLGDICIRVSMISSLHRTVVDFLILINLNRFIPWRKY